MRHGSTFKQRDFAGRKHFALDLLLIENPFPISKP